MPLVPKFQNQEPPQITSPNNSAAAAQKCCIKCGRALPRSEFARSRSIFAADHLTPICGDCIDTLTQDTDSGFAFWDKIDMICRLCDIPFIPKEWEKTRAANPTHTFLAYSQIFGAEPYKDEIGWRDYYNAFLELKQENELNEELPGFSEQRRATLTKRWGANYDDEALEYLENLYQSLLKSQNVDNGLQVDQALKLCKMSYEIDCRIRAGEDFDKILASYEKLTKIADFTPKSSKNSNDFDNLGQLARWLEKRGWKNKYYDDVPKDVVDETIRNIQAWNQHLYTDESGIGDEITQRIENLKVAKQLEDNEGYYVQDSNSADELDKYSNDGYTELLKEEDEDFQIGDE